MGAFLPLIFAAVVVVMVVEVAAANLIGQLGPFQFVVPEKRDSTFYEVVRIVLLLTLSSCV